jgi:AraC-like DNA-binding protein
MDITHFATEQAISTMWSRYADPLSLDEIADSAILSKFYFSRVFRSLTGTSPGRFLAAIRLFKAKNLLLETDMSVTEVAYGVGYNSLGTFTSRFTRSVGASPARYRAMSLAGTHSILDMAPEPGPGPHGEVSGVCSFPETDDSLRVYIGLFPGPVVEGVPVACDVLETPGPFVLRDVPVGSWYLRAAAVSLGKAQLPWQRRPALLGEHGHPHVGAHGRVSVGEMALRLSGFLDPPIVRALPELDNWGLAELHRAA